MSLEIELAKKIGYMIKADMERAADKVAKAERDLEVAKLELELLRERHEKAGSIFHAHKKNPEADPLSLVDM